MAASCRALVSTRYPGAFKRLSSNPSLRIFSHCTSFHLPSLHTSKANQGKPAFSPALPPNSQLPNTLPFAIICGLQSSHTPASLAPLVLRRLKSTTPTSAITRQGTGSPTTMAPLTFRHIPHKSLHVSTPTWWLESRFHFSFAEYHNPANMNFGVLRVLNDDLVQPQSGFGRHPHRNMEIVTYVVNGQLTHRDSMGSEESLGRGSVQYMSAGTGVTHSEMNHSDELLRFLQVWILPNASGLKPNYGSRCFNKADRLNKLQQVVTSYDKLGGSSDTGTGLIPIHQDVAVFVTEMDPGVTLTFPIGKGRQLYAVCIEGAVTVGGSGQSVKLEARDACEVVNHGTEGASLVLNANGESAAHAFLIEMAEG